jgi:hypothetical protein
MMSGAEAMRIAPLSMPSPDVHSRSHSRGKENDAVIANAGTGRAIVRPGDEPNRR